MQMGKERCLKALQRTQTRKGTDHVAIEFMSTHLHRYVATEPCESNNRRLAAKVEAAEMDVRWNTLSNDGDPLMPVLDVLRLSRPAVNRNLKPNPRS